MRLRRWFWVIWLAGGLAALALLLFQAIVRRQGFKEVEAWVGAFCTLSIFSFLYKENTIYRLGEHLMLGTSIGFSIGATVYDLLRPLWWIPLLQGFQQHEAGDIFAGLSAAAVGLLWYGLFFKRTVWLSRLVMGIVMGAGAGLSIKQLFLQTVPQITDSFKSPIVLNELGRFDAPKSVNNVIFLVAMLLTVNFFFFSFDHTRKVSERIEAFLDRRPIWLRNTLSVLFMVFSGRFWLMLAFGVFFGNTVMTRLSVFIERIWYLIEQWAQPILQNTPR